MSLTKAEQTIQLAAWKDFPAQELWIKDDKYFWAYEKGDSCVYITCGTYTESSLTHNETEVVNTSEPDVLVDKLIIEKIAEGWKCFSSELFG
jgi:hypothetical protein